MKVSTEEFHEAGQTVILQDIDEKKQQKFAVAGKNCLLGTTAPAAKCASQVMAGRIQSDSITLAKRPTKRSSTALGGLYELLATSPNFDWMCNPAGADGELITAEMLRTFLGLPDCYSFPKGGLGKFMPHIHEALMLVYHGTSYTHPVKETGLLVAYGVEAKHVKPFLFCNCEHVKQTPYKDVFRTHFDTEEFKKIIKKDKELGFMPHFLVIRPATIKELHENEKLWIDLANELELIHFLDLSLLGVQVLKEGILSKIDSPFVFLDLTEIGHLSSGILFLQDRAAYSANISNPPQEYLNHPEDFKRHLRTGEPEVPQKLTDHKFEAHGFNIGFSNFVSWQRILFFLIAKGKKGIQRELDNQTKNVKAIFHKLEGTRLAKSLLSLENAVLVQLPCKARDIAKVFQEKEGFLPYDFIGSEDVALLQAPLDVLDDKELDLYFQKLTEAYETL